MVATDEDENHFETPPTGLDEDNETPQIYYSAAGDLNSDPKREAALNHRANDYINLDARMQMGLPIDYYPNSSYNEFHYQHSNDWKKYSNALHTLIPIRFKTKQNKTTIPVDDIGLLNFISYHWLTKLMWKAYRKGCIPIESLPKCSPLEACDMNCQRIEYLWKCEVQSHGPEKASLHAVIWRFMRTRMLVALFLFVVSLVTGFVGPTIFMRKLLEYAQKKEVYYTEGLVWLLGLFIMECARVVMFAAMWAINYRTALRLRSACLALLFCKVMRLRNLGDKSIGEFINLFANDGARIFEFVTYGPLIIGGPIVAIGGVIFIGSLLGLPALAGMATFILFYPFQYLISRLTGRFRKQTILVTDERVRFMNELLTSIKLIKLYAWEKPFTKKISEIRKKEKKLLEKAAYVQSTSIAMAPTVPIVAAIVTFLAHIGAGNNLTAAEAFSVWGTYQAIRFAFAILPYSVKSSADMKPSLNRMQAFTVICLCVVIRGKLVHFVMGFACTIGAAISFRRLKAFTVVTIMCMLNFAFRVVPIYAIQIVNGKIGFRRFQSVLLMEDNISLVTTPANVDDAICVNNATFAWDNLQAHKANKRKRKKSQLKFLRKTHDERFAHGEDQQLSPKVIYTLQDINLVLKKGQLIGVCGSVGSGKSSLIAAILGQMRLINGQVSLRGSCAYVAQQAWLMNATLQENILFGETLDNKRYYEAISSCSLNADISLLPGGDQTEIGERGINLSGGQKQRVSLARAVYSNRDVYLLDDPLSAVDAHVGLHIFKHCIQGALKDKSVILVTHQLQFLSSCDHILLMKEGKVIEQGSHDVLMTANSEYANLIHNFLTEDESPVASDNETNSATNITVSTIRRQRTTSSESSVKKSKEEIKSGRLITAEHIEKGEISTKTYLDYMRAGGGFLISFLVLLSFAVNIGATAFSSWWLSQWINQGSGGVEITDPKTNTTRISDSITDNPNLDMYQIVYGMSIVVIIFTSFIRSFAFMKATLKASSALHEKVFTKVFRSPMSFFDVTPIGRIINVFSVDMDEIDVRLPFTAETFLQNLWVIIFSLLFVSMVFPLFLVPLTVLSIVFYFLYTIFRVSIRELKRLENVSRSPIYSHVTATIQGLATIHAYGKEHEFINRFMEYLDSNTSPFYLFNCGMRWLALRLDLLVVSITLTAGLFVVFTHGNVPAAFAGLALAYAAQLSGLFQYTVRLSTETEARFTSVEKIARYSETLEPEAPAIIETNRPPMDWPNEGLVEFENVTLRYRPGLPLVLKGLSFIIKPQEKIGIVGRTGSGKSSLGVALFRLTEIASGRIYIDNLDVAKIGLEDLRSRMSLIPQDPILFIGTIRYNLDPFDMYSDEQIWKALDKTYMKDKVSNLEGALSSFVVENGENFSVGERQLLCMARALLRNSKILLLDEATASIDTETDSLIQTTIHEAFAHCTILTIAHRLPTVLSCHRVMVLDDGQIVEMNKPSILLSKPNSAFAQMMSSSSAHR